MGETILDLVREYFPDASEDEADFILWERTAFPMNSVDGLRTQLAEFKQAVGRYPNAGFCDFCNNLAVTRGLCISCAAAWRGNRLLLTAG